MTFRRALTVGGVAALLASAIAVAGAGAGPDATPPGKGKARRAGRLRSRERQEGHGGADQTRRPRHADPGRRLHDDRQDGGGVLQVRQRQRRHPRPSDQLQALHRGARPEPGEGARAQADRRRQGRRRRREHELRRVRHELEVLQEQGLRRDRRRRAGRVLQHAVVRGGELWPAVQQRGCGAGIDRGRCEEARDRVAGHALRLRRRRAGARREEGRHPGEDLPDAPAGHRRDLAAAPDVPVRR